MTESDGKVFTTTFSPEPKPEDQHQADLQELRRQKQALDAAVIQVRPVPRGTMAQVHPDSREIWSDKVYKLAEKIREDYLPQIKAGTISLSRALDEGAKLYVRPDGRPFTGASLRNRLKQQTNKTQGLI